jgi:diaminohydroxyphosphoribosylaminopyrimidine deaminase/5-amino-6-(5-phosphoribosylamino)uracil reductase
MTADERFMRRALDLARRGEGETEPNPMVGCVIVKAGRVEGEGGHRGAGGPHAEVVALARAGRRARGATMYVNLEPCSHSGRTPPCAPQVAAAGIARVVVAMRDPNPRVHGRGLAELHAAGLRLETGMLEPEALRLNRRFVVAATRRRPFVLLKAALTLDGRIATGSGESKWITSPAQRLEARRLRRLHGGVVVGVGTALADDPLLLPAPLPARPFVRIVLDSLLRIPLRSRLVRSVQRSPVWVVCGRRAPEARRRRLESRGVTVIRIPGRSRRPPLSAVLGELKRRGVWSLMVEGGAEVLGAFLHERLFDEASRAAWPTRCGCARPTSRPRARSSSGTLRGRDDLGRRELMFTGIVEATGTVVSAERRGDVLAVRFAAESLAAGLPLGGSIAVDGCCLTAVAVDAAGFTCELTEETLRRTAFGERLRPGVLVNLERPMKADGRFDGHIVQGHVDGIGRIRALQRLQDSAEMVVVPPPGLVRYLVPKGSVAVDGISLTVADLEDGAFKVALIPYTLEVTSLRAKAAGERVNLEVDVIAKYVERLLLARGMP